METIDNEFAQCLKWLAVLYLNVKRRNDNC